MQELPVILSKASAPAESDAPTTPRHSAPAAARLEQQVLDLLQELEERTDDLNAARAANRDLMSLANRKPASPA